MDIEAARKKLIADYSGTFSKESEEFLKEIADEKTQISDYNIVSMTCCLFLSQMAQEVSALYLTLFREITITDYNRLKNNPIFLNDYGDILETIQEQIIKFISSFPSIYIRFGFDAVEIDFSAMDHVKVSTYMSAIGAAYLELPIILTTSTLKFFDLIVGFIDSDKNQKSENLEAKRLGLSAIVITVQSMYNLLFIDLDDDDEDNEDQN